MHIWVSGKITTILRELAVTFMDFFKAQSTPAAAVIKKLDLIRVIICG